MTALGNPTRSFTSKTQNTYYVLYPPGRPQFGIEFTLRSIDIGSFAIIERHAYLATVDRGLSILHSILINLPKIRREKASQSYIESPLCCLLQGYWEYFEMFHPL